VTVTQGLFLSAASLMDSVEEVILRVQNYRAIVTVRSLEYGPNIWVLYKMYVLTTSQNAHIRAVS
jgi:hypothetical protein